MTSVMASNTAWAEKVSASTPTIGVATSMTRARIEPRVPHARPQHALRHARLEERPQRRVGAGIRESAEKPNRHGHHEDSSCDERIAIERDIEERPGQEGPLQDALWGNGGRHKTE